MFTGALMVTVCCVLFIHMGLCEAVERTFRYKFKIISCVRCLTFWCDLLYLTVTSTPVIHAVFYSFTLSYMSLWLEVLLTVTGRFYERIYSEIYAAPDKDGSGETA